MKELPVRPFSAPARGIARVPGSKSLSNRALLLAFLAGGETRVANLLASEDTEALREAFVRLGVGDRETPEGDRIVGGCAGHPPADEARIDVRNAGTVARFLPAALSLREGGSYEFDGSAAMRKRPMSGLLAALEALGARVTFGGERGHFPFRLEPRGWRRTELSVDASRSSQILSALLLAATRAPAPTRISLRGGTVSRPFVEMTLGLIRRFGGDADHDGDDFRVRPGLAGPAGGRYSVEPDATAASYFLALPLAVGGSLDLRGFPEDSLQGDLAFADVLGRAGVAVTRGDGVLSARTGRASGAGAGALFLDEDFNAISDTFLTLAALAPLLPGPIRIRGIGHTRHQETDRVAAIAAESRKLGQGVEESDDGLLLRPDTDELRRRAAGGPIPVDTYGDHRVAMSFGILGCHDLFGDGRPWIAIRDPDCCGKTFPGFFDELARLRAIAESGSPSDD